MKLSHVVWLAIAAAAVVAIVAGVRAVQRASSEAGAGLETVVSGIPAGAAAGAASENIRVAILALDAFFAQNASYAGLTTEELRRLDPGLDGSVTVVWARSDGACVQSTVRGVTASATRPTGAVVAGSC